MAQGDAQFSSASPFVHHQYVYDANNRMTQSITEEGSTTTTADYYYDHNGNQITKAVNVTTPQTGVAAYFMSPDTNSYLSIYEYDSYNRLKSADTDGTVTTYTYDGNNLRQSKTSNGITTQHIWDGSNMVMDGTNKFYRGATGIEFAILNGNTSFYHKDAHGDVTALTDNAGTITQSYIYDAFGNQLNENENDTNPFRYCGEYVDSETGLTYLRNRYYDNAIGRFITEDPIKDGLNWYVYCENNPVMYVDPLGLGAWLIHGTNLNNDPTPEKTWTQDFREFLEKNVLNDGEKTYTPRWSGGNDKESRKQAAEQIAKEIITYHQNNPDEPIRLIGHSHGGNVAIMITNILSKEGIKVKNLVTIATPVREYQLEKGVTVGQHINVYNNSDQVQVRGGHVAIHIGAVLFNGIDGLSATSASRKFPNATNKNAKSAFKLYRPIYTHSSMHSNIDIWKEYIVPEFKK